LDERFQKIKKSCVGHTTHLVSHPCFRPLIFDDTTVSWMTMLERPRLRAHRQTRCAFGKSLWRFRLHLGVVIYLVLSAATCIGPFNALQHVPCDQLPETLLHLALAVL
jgi:hypothetical protein